VSDGRTVSCPQCDTSFLVAEAHLKQAGGLVRCGNCLQVFDGNTGEIDFVAPTLPDAVPFELEVRPMADAELPRQAERPSRIALTLLVLLVLALGAQLLMRQQAGQAGAAALELSNLVIRPHPEAAQALRLDAILRNPTERDLAYPAIWLGFSNSHGEARAQRLFQPGEYLHGEHPSSIPANSQVQLSLSLQDPGHDAVNFLARLHSVTYPPD